MVFVSSCIPFLRALMLSCKLSVSCVSFCMFLSCSIVFSSKACSLAALWSVHSSLAISTPSSGAVRLTSSFFTGSFFLLPLLESVRIRINTTAIPAMIKSFTLFSLSSVVATSVSSSFLKNFLRNFISVPP